MLKTWMRGDTKGHCWFTADWMMQEGDSDHDSGGVAESRQLRRGPDLIRQNIMTRMELPDLIWPVGFDPTQEPQGYV